MERRRLLVADHVSKVLGGAEINVVELLGHPEVRKRWDVTVACAPGSPLDAALTELPFPRVPYGFAASLNELRIVGRGFSPLGKLRGYLELRRASARLSEILAAVRPESVLTPTNKDHFAAGAAARRAGIPSFWWVNDLITAEFFNWPVRHLFAAKARRLAHRLVPVSEAGAEALRAHGIPGTRIRVVQNGIPLERYRRNPARPLRAELGIGPGEPLIGMAGRITPWKGQALFLDVADDWVRSGRPGRFVIIGRAFNEDAPFEAALRERLGAGPLAGRASIVPFQPDIASALSSLDVLLHTSLKAEPFGRVLIESMAVGTPVVAARAGGVTGILRDGVDGHLVAPGDRSAYVSALGSILATPELQRDYAGRAAERVREQFSLDRVFADFDSLLDPHARPAPRTA